MKDYIICTPVMLPQKGELQFPSICIGTPELGLRYTDTKFGYEGTVYQHLYLVSDEEIKEGEQYIWLKEVHIATEFTIRLGHARNPIIATTDKSLSLPMIPYSFIERWVAKQGKIDKLRLLLHWDDFREEHTNELELSNDEVIIIEDIRYYHDIHCSASPYEPMGNEGCSCTMYQRARKSERKLEDKTYNREEFRTEMDKAYSAGITKGREKDRGDYPCFNNWFDKNYPILESNPLPIEDKTYSREEVKLIVLTAIEMDSELNIYDNFDNWFDKIYPI